MSRFRTFFRLPSVDRRIALEAFVLLGLSRTAVLLLPFRWLSPILGTKKNSLNEEGPAPATILPKARHISWAIRLMSGHTPWKSNCLAKAIAGRIMLKRRKLPGTVYFGMAKDTNGELEAHAWLKSGEKILTGESELDQYAVVAIFSD